VLDSHDRWIVAEALVDLGDPVLPAHRRVGFSPGPIMAAWRDLVGG
jgi:hypothetical protein